MYQDFDAALIHNCDVIWVNPKLFVTRNYNDSDDLDVGLSKCCLEGTTKQHIFHNSAVLHYCFYLFVLCFVATEICL